MQHLFVARICADIHHSCPPPTSCRRIFSWSRTWMMFKPMCDGEMVMVVTGVYIGTDGVGRGLPCVQGLSWAIVLGAGRYHRYTSAAQNLWVSVTQNWVWRKAYRTEGTDISWV